jgi:hypothetical protein
MDTGPAQRLRIRRTSQTPAGHAIRPAGLLFIGLLQAGVPLGVTFSFLIAAPMVNEIALAMLFRLFGWKIAALYLVMGLAVAVVIGKLGMEHHLEGGGISLSGPKIPGQMMNYRTRARPNSQGWPCAGFRKPRCSKKLHRR